MVDVGFEEGISEGFETETFVERNGRDLGVKTDSLCALSFCFGKEGVHETGTEALMADSGKHTTDTEDRVVRDEFAFVGV